MGIIRHADIFVTWHLWLIEQKFLILRGLKVDSLFPTFEKFHNKIKCIKISSVTQIDYFCDANLILSIYYPSSIGWYPRHYSTTSNIDSSTSNNILKNALLQRTFMNCGFHNNLITFKVSVGMWHYPCTERRNRNVICCEFNNIKMAFRHFL